MMITIFFFITIIIGILTISTMIINILTRRGRDRGWGALSRVEGEVELHGIAHVHVSAFVRIRELSQDSPP